MLASAWVLMKVCGDPVSKGNTVELYGNGAAVYLDFGGERRVIHRYYTNNTRSLFGEQG